MPKEWSKKLSEEMARVFPQQVYVSRENDLLNLQITSEWLSEAARYFMANAALFSGDLDTAQFFLEYLKTSKRLIQYKGIEGVAHLRALVPQRLAEVYGLKSRFAHAKWTETRDIADLEIATKYLSEFHTLQPDDIRYYSGMAVWHFVRNRDVESALAELEHCRGRSDATWRYSVAFLEAYRGNLRQAERVYTKAFSRPVQQFVPFEVEDFIGWVLEQEPDKFQLHYCLGLINWHAKRDVEMARRDFELFIKKASAHNAFPHQIEEAKGYINRLKRSAA